MAMTDRSAGKKIGGGGQLPPPPGAATEYDNLWHEYHANEINATNYICTVRCIVKSFMYFIIIIIIYFFFTFPHTFIATLYSWCFGQNSS